MRIIGLAALLIFVFACTPATRKHVPILDTILPTLPATLEPCENPPFSARISASSSIVPVGATVTLHMEHDYSGDNSYGLYARDEDQHEGGFIFAGAPKMFKNKTFQSKNFEPLSGGGYIEMNVVLRAIHIGKTTFYGTVNGEYAEHYRDSDLSCITYFNFDYAKTQEIVIQAVHP